MYSSPAGRTNQLFFRIVHLLPDDTVTSTVGEVDDKTDSHPDYETEPCAFGKE